MTYRFFWFGPPESEYDFFKEYKAEVNVDHRLNDATKAFLTNFFMEGSAERQDAYTKARAMNPPYQWVYIEQGVGGVGNNGMWTPFQYGTRDYMDNVTFTRDQILKPFRLMKDYIFPTIVTPSFTDAGHLKIDIEEGVPYHYATNESGAKLFQEILDIYNYEAETLTNPPESQSKYQPWQSLNFRQIVFLPTSTLFTDTLGFSHDQLTYEFEPLSVMYIMKGVTPDSGTSKFYDFHAGHNSIMYGFLSWAPNEVLNFGAVPSNSYNETVEGSNTVEHVYAKAIHVRTNLVHHDMVDSYEGRFTNTLCVVPIHAAAGESIYSRNENSSAALESSQITLPNINKISVTLVDEHSNTIQSNSDVYMVLQFQFYKIPVLNKPIQDVRDRLRYFKEKVRQINKPRNSIKNGNKKKRKNKKKKGGAAKAKPGTAGDRVRPRTAAAKEAEAQP